MFFVSGSLSDTVVNGWVGEMQLISSETIPLLCAWNPPFLPPTVVLGMDWQPWELYRECLGPFLKTQSPKGGRSNSPHSYQYRHSGANTLQFSWSLKRFGALISREACPAQCSSTAGPPLGLQLERLTAKKKKKSLLARMKWAKYYEKPMANVFYEIGQQESHMFPISAE